MKTIHATHGGYRQGSGRPKGSPNKTDQKPIDQEIMEAVIKKGYKKNIPIEETDINVSDNQKMVLLKDEKSNKYCLIEKTTNYNRYCISVFSCKDPEDLEFALLTAGTRYEGTIGQIKGTLKIMVKKI